MVAATLDDGLLKPNRIAKVTLDFWFVTLLVGTIGGTVADDLSFRLGFGISAAAWIMGTLLVMALILQFHQRRYVPWVYWTTILLISVVAALVSDEFAENLGTPLETVAAFFAIALMMSFALWSLWEETLSIHSIITTRREVFYWLAIFLTFAFATAAGDLVAEKLGLGYLETVALFAILAGLFWLAYRLKLNSTFCFWPAYLLTHPLGNAFGNLLARHRSAGGLGLGTTATGLIFIACVILTVVYMTWSNDGEEFATESN